MKFLLNLVRVLVGTLFIFSGLVKANDPLGLSYKMKEFFEIWNSGLEHSHFFLNHTLISFFLFLHDHSLVLSVLMIVFEIIAGVALLLGWKMKLFSWLLLLLIVFFTFLTGYAFYSGKFTNCGCFGDCLPITPRISFLKDLALTVLIVFLFAFKSRIRPFLPGGASLLIMIASALFSFGVQWYVLNYLPLVDCLPFKKGNNIAEKMKSPPGAVEDSFAIRFVYEKNGKRFEFSPSELPSDLNTYTFKDRIDKLVRKGNADPPIKGFSLRTESGDDSTDSILSKPYCFLLFSESFATAVAGWEKNFEAVVTSANSTGIPVYIVTASRRAANLSLARTSLNNIQILECDFTVIRTAARTEPCLYLLKRGTVMQKWSYRTMASASTYLSGTKP